LKVFYNKKFLKDLSRIPGQDRLKIEEFVFDKIKFFKVPKDVTGIEKLEGYKNYFKIRFGNYRAGIHIDEDVLTFERILHRKEIYRFFP
jgi:mRNA interferase RelE/StbE